MTDPLKIEIGTVIRWKKNPPRSPRSRNKPAYFIFLGCYKLDDEDVNEWYVILARTTSRVDFYIDGDRKEEPHVLINMDGKHPCFNQKSAVGYRDFYVNRTINDFQKHIKNGNIEKKCNLNKNELAALKKLFKEHSEVPDIIKDLEIGYLVNK